MSITMKTNSIHYENLIKRDSVNSRRHNYLNNCTPVGLTKTLLLNPALK